MAKSYYRRRSWLWVYDVYGVEDGALIMGLLAQAAVTVLSTAVLVSQFRRIVAVVTGVMPFMRPQILSLLLGFALGLMGLMTVCFLVTAVNLFYTNVLLCYRMSHEMLKMVKDWSGIETALDVGCGRGMLLNAVATKLKKEGGGGRVVGVDLWLQDGNNRRRRSMSGTLKTASREGTQALVTCKSGDARHLPFNDAHFDLVVSGLFLHNLGKDIFGTVGAYEAALAERFKAVLEMVRVLKPGGHVVIWDLHYVPEYRKKLQEAGMEDIVVSECITAYMVPSHILHAKKPS